MVVGAAFMCGLGFPSYCNARRYIDNMLRPVVIPFMNCNFRGVFQQYNAPAHTARPTTAFLATNGIHTLDWPSLSPDMGPI